MDFADRDAMLERLATVAREVVFLVGAPLTAPAGPAGLGVPGVKAMVERIRALFQGRERALKQLDEVLAAAPNPYQAAFRHVIHFRGADTANQIIRDAVLEACLPEARPKGMADGITCERLENDLDGWSYPPGVAALGQLVARFPARFGRTVLTTNFDPLIELAVRRAGGRTYSSLLHSDGSLEQSRGQGCHVVHLHGYWHGTDTLHSPAQLGQDRPQVRASLARLLHNRTIVVIAYGGWDDIFTRTLQEVTADLGAYPEVLWCFYDGNEDKIRAANAHLFEQLKPAIGRQRAVFYKGIDCHAFLPDLVAELDGAAPGAHVGVYQELAPARDDAMFVGRTAQKEELLRALDRSQAVQLIGPRRMGKSSLLRWVERHARTLGHPVAFINARGLAGHSPSDLVLAAAEALGKRGEVQGALYADSALPGADAAARALERLAPACLLVDEAGALAEADHGFDKGFFDTLRALGQAGKIQWISASERDLFGMFCTTGLTSAFLNDARKIRVGALSRAEAEEFLRERGVDLAERVFAYDLAGGHPSALSEVARRLGKRPIDRAGIEGDLRRWIHPLFVLWWRRLDAASRALLKRAVTQGLPIDGLSGEERGRAQGLMDDGFLAESTGGFELGGLAWREFVRDVS
jgi:hypothetical protein